MTKPTISVVIPVYRSEKTIEELYNRLSTILEVSSSKFEVIFVEDSGGDDSWEIIKKIAGSDDRVRGIKFHRNYGQHNALLCGIRNAQYEITITMDDDLQHPPEEIPKLLESFSNEIDVVYAVPQQEKHGLFRNLISKSTKTLLQRSMGITGATHISSFRAFRTNIKTAFENFNSPFVTIDVLLSWGTRRFSHTVVIRDSRKVGRSTYQLQKLIKHSLNLITGFTTIPLRFTSLIGFVFMLFGLAVLAYVLIRYITVGIVLPGFTFLSSIIAIFSGVQLFALGIIGEYLARIFQKLSGQPAYQISEQV